MPTDEQLRDTLEMVNSGFVNIGGTYAADILEEVLRRRTTHAELIRVLTGIATLWPEPESCGGLSVNGINDGKQRLITAHYAVNAARKALRMPLHTFPGEAVPCELCGKPSTPYTPCLGDILHDSVD